MAKQVINIGAAPNDGTGDSLRDSFDKSNDNFTELYNPQKIEFDTVTPPTVTPEGTIWWNGDEFTLNITTGLGPTIQVGQETLMLFYNDSAVDTIDNLKVIRPASATVIGGIVFPTLELADAGKWEGTEGTLSVTTMDIPPVSLGFSVKFGRGRGGDTSGFTPGEQLWLAADGSGDMVNTKPEFPDYQISMGGALNSELSPDGEVFVSITRDVYDTFNDTWDGGIRETFDFTVSAVGGTVITGLIENIDNTRDLTMLFSDGFNTLDTTTVPLTIVLTPGTDGNPQTNFVYIPKSTKVLTVSTSGFPTTEHIKIADLFLRSAATTETDDALVNRNWNDHLKREEDNGHLLHIAERLRQEHAKWDSGTEGVCTIGGGGTTVDASVTAGVVYQLHKQTFPSFDTSTGDDVHVPNHFITPYLTTSDIEDLVADASGNSLTNTSYSFVLWGVQNKDGESSHIMINLPSDTYSKNTPANAVSDALNYSVYTIPKAFEGKGFLIARFTYVNNGGVISLFDTEDLRGKIPNAAAGGGAGGTGVTTFLALTDTPSTYISLAFQRANVGATALENVVAADIDLSEFGQDIGLQEMYDNSTQPQIEIDAVNGALQIKSDTGDDADNVQEWLNNAGSVVGEIDGNGNVILNGSIIFDGNSAFSANKTKVYRDSNLGFVNQGYNAAVINAYTLITPAGIRVIENPVSTDNIALNSSSGNTLIGTTTDNTVDKLQVIGSIAADAYGTTVQTLTETAGAVAWDMSSGSKAKVTIDETSVITITNMPVGAEGTIMITQGDAGDDNVTFVLGGATVKWRGGDQELTDTSGAIDRIKVTNMDGILLVELDKNYIDQ